MGVQKARRVDNCDSIAALGGKEAPLPGRRQDSVQALVDAGEKCQRKGWRPSTTSTWSA